jgi:putative ABC transport system permease protein
MRALDRKLLRNLWSLKAQGLAIALVVAGGVATFVMSLAALDSLRLTQREFYREYRFADVFADLKRAPESLAVRLRELPGVATVETRVRAPVNLQVEGYDQPVTGQVVSIPEGAQPALNRLFLRSGALPDPGRDDQVLVSEAFAEAHGLAPGDRLGMILNGRHQRLLVAGVALSPEYIYQIRPGDLFPDFKRYAVLWMNRPALAAAFGMEGAFNNATLSLAPGRPAAQVVEQLDLLLEAWGGLGAHDRDVQISHRYLDQELEQLETMARVVPMIFLGVAAFLLNVVAARLVRTQREQIAVLKAFGYSDFAVAAHYLMLVMAVVAIGSVAGVLAGVWLADGMGKLYQEFFRFPWLRLQLRPQLALFAIGIAAAAAAVGALIAVRAAFRLPPAEAMRPAPPARYRRTVIERLGLGRLLSQPTRIVLRNLERQPVKSALSVLGIALSVAILVLSGLQEGAIGRMIDVQFRVAQRQDVMVAFNEPASQRAVHELAALPGVRHVEGFRAVPVILRHGHREYRTTLQGYQPDGQLFRVLDDRLRPIALDEEGVMMTGHLGRLLGLGAGDRVQVQVLDGRRARLDIPVAGLVTEYIGVGAYLPQQTLNRLLREGPAISGAFLAVAPEALHDTPRRLEQMPRVAGVTLREHTIGAFRELMGETMLVYALFVIVLAGSIAFAVVYNNARIALAERSHELSSLRVLGFTRAEIAYVLLGELAVLTLAAIPLGFAIGAGFGWLVTLAMQNDLFRIPFVIEPPAFATAAATVLAAALLSSLLVGRNLRRLDMVAALKASE